MEFHSVTSLGSKIDNCKNLQNKNLEADEALPHYVRVIFLTDMKGRERPHRVPAALDLDRPKRPRTTFSNKQIQVLESEFAQSHFVSVSKRHLLSSILGLSETQIKVWFQNKRTKVKRLSQENSKVSGVSSMNLIPAFSTFAKLKCIAN